MENDNIIPIKAPEIPADAEVITLTAEDVPEESVRIDLQNSLVKVGVTEKMLIELENYCQSLDIKNFDDREGYDIVVEARKRCKATRILVEKISSEWRAELVRKQKAWIAGEEKVVSRIEIQEKRLLEKEKAWKEEFDKRKAEKKRIEESRISDRTAKLIQLGAKVIEDRIIIDQYGELPAASVSISELKSLDDEIFNEEYLSAFVAIFEKKSEDQRAKEEQERIEKENAEKLRLDNERKQRELDEKLREIERQEEEKKEAIRNVRHQELSSLGLSYSPQHKRYSYEDIQLEMDYKSLNISNEKEWNELLSLLSKRVDDTKKQKKKDEVFSFRKKSLNSITSSYNEEELYEMSDEEWEKFFSEKLDLYNKEQSKIAVGNTRKSMLESINIRISLSEVMNLSEEEWNEMYSKMKSDYDENQLKIKQYEEDKRKREEQVTMSNRKKYESFISNLLAVEIPSISGGVYEKKIELVKQKLAEISSL